MPHLPAAIAACMLLTLAACGGKQVLETTVITPTQRPDQMPVIPPAFDNPATRNCLTLGGTVTIQAGSGAPTSFCALPGGALIDSDQLLAETRLSV